MRSCGKNAEKEDFWEGHHQSVGRIFVGEMTIALKSEGLQCWTSSEGVQKSAQRRHCRCSGDPIFSSTGRNQEGEDNLMLSTTGRALHYEGIVSPIPGILCGFIARFVQCV